MDGLTVPHRCTHGVTVWPRSPPPRCTPKRNRPHKNSYTRSESIIHQTENRHGPRVLSGGWIITV